MTGTRANGQALRQSRGLAALEVSRRRRPGPGPGAIVGVDVLLLAVLDSLEHGCNLARLGRASADPTDPDADPRWRRLVLLTNALAQAIATDIRTGDTDASHALYRAITDYQAHKETR